MIIPAIAMLGVLLFGAREPILFVVGNFLVIAGRTSAR